MCDLYWQKVQTTCDLFVLSVWNDFNLPEQED